MVFAIVFCVVNEQGKDPAPGRGGLIRFY